MPSLAQLASLEGCELPRADVSNLIHSAIESYQVTILTGALGFGQAATLRATLDRTPDWNSSCSDGNWRTGGYLSGFHDLIVQAIALAEVKNPSLVARYEQTLKRIFPYRLSSAYRIPKDLTNSASREERTRFYHFEYQEKLLVGLSEFIRDYFCEFSKRVIVIIDNAGSLSPTSQRFIDIVGRQQRSAEYFRIVLLDSDSVLFFPQAQTIAFPSFSPEDFYSYLSLSDARPIERDLIYRLSHGNLCVGRAVKHCIENGISAANQPSAESVIDLYLATLNSRQRKELAIEFVRKEFIGNLIVKRNFATLDPSLLDTENISRHADAMESYKRGETPLVFAHALAIGNKFERIEALVEPCDILMGIGLYDTWFSFFAPMFADHELRTYGDGDQLVNGLFINAAFVLYAMGNSNVSAPFLDEFIDNFPNSRFIPTALYAQSMTYGRYQVPVDLVRAEGCAIRNLELIDGRFRDHPKYQYIKVFAENAYAYIKARQGKFVEALALCERGNVAILSSYGEHLYQLHRSILIYNTSQVFEIIGDHDRAEERLREAIRLDPYYAEYQNDLGNLLSRLGGREQEALHAYARAIALSPPYYDAHLNRGMLRAEIGDFTGAMEDFARTLEIKPTEWRALREIGTARLVSGDFVEALAAFKQAIECGGGRDADLQANFGLAHSELGDSEGAVRCYLSAIALNASHAEAHNNLAAGSEG